ncbi:MAG: AMP-binding protein [Thermodesulfobacteriota bacterium]|nr:AMP-binding protein [Thermodesulfobacteriota bacterium]
MSWENEYWNKELETMPFENLRDHQLKRLKAQLQYAYENSPYYKRSFDAVKIKTDDIRSFEDYLDTVPFISKSKIIEIQALNPPFGDLMAVDKKELNQLFYAPGPIIFPFTPEEWGLIVESAASALFTMGTRKEDIADCTVNYNWVIAGKLLDDAMKRVGCTVLPGGVGMTKTHIELMRLTSCSILFGFPTFCQQLVQTAREMGLQPDRDLSIRLVHVFGEVRTDAGKKELGDAFGAEVRELYGTAELGIVAVECPEGGGMHLDPNVFVEILDPQTGKPVTWGEGGEICGCDFTRKAIPIIRYRTGDITEGLNLSSCPCGRTTPRLKKILGRVGDIPRVKGMFISSRQIENVLESFPKLGRYQIIVDRPEIRDELTVKVEYKEVIPFEKTAKKLSEDLKVAIRVTPQIKFVEKGTIPDDVPLVNDKREV